MALLPKLHVNRNTSRTIIFGLERLGGLSLPHNRKFDPHRPIVPPAAIWEQNLCDESGSIQIQLDRAGLATFLMGVYITPLPYLLLP
jgi:hypothetical protein